MNKSQKIKKMLLKFKESFANNSGNFLDKEINDFQLEIS